MIMTSFLDLLVAQSVALLLITVAGLLYTVRRIEANIRLALPELFDLAQQIADFGNIMASPEKPRYTFSDRTASPRPFREELMEYLDQEGGQSSRGPSLSPASDCPLSEAEEFEMDDVFQDIFTNPAGSAAPAELDELADYAVATGWATSPVQAPRRRSSFPPAWNVRRPTGIYRFKRHQLPRPECSDARNHDEED
ncbi:hypothetical protein PWT90_05892 [Aphanocladium album]|nr:hypothetical protein PWT90_05892 [Aphanocladium album]